MRNEKVWEFRTIYRNGIRNSVAGFGITKSLSLNLFITSNMRLLPKSTKISVNDSNLIGNLKILAFFLEIMDPNLTD